MGKSQKHNDNDIVNPERKDNDNDIVKESGSYLRQKVLEQITEHKLETIQDFMFGGPNGFYGDCGVFINPAIKQAERFFYIWMSELTDETRKAIVTYCLGNEYDDRRHEYKQYLNSPVWRYVSSVIKIFKGCKCEKCGEQYNPAHLVVHHLTYTHLGSELNHLEDISVLCTDCHKEVHGIRRENECK